MLWNYCFDKKVQTVSFWTHMGANQNEKPNQSINVWIMVEREGDQSISRLHLSSSIVASSAQDEVTNGYPKTELSYYVVFSSRMLLSKV